MAYQNCGTDSRDQCQRYMFLIYGASASRCRPKLVRHNAEVYASLLQIVRSRRGTFAFVQRHKYVVRVSGVDDWEWVAYLSSLGVEKSQ